MYSEVEVIAARTAIFLVRKFQKEVVDSQNSITRSCVWKLLTALRAPDVEDQDVKWHTAAVVRREVAPDLAGEDAMVADKGAWFWGSREMSFRGTPEHYIWHAEAARRVIEAAALGLMEEK